jgi:protein ImuA
MRVVSARELFETLGASKLKASKAAPALATGLPALDCLPPGSGFACGAVHEVLSEGGSALLLPLLIAREAAKRGWVVWCDLLGEFYPPAAAALGIELSRLLILRPSNAQEETWAATECLRCNGVSACVASTKTLSFLQARRFQLAAERGGGIGLLLRPAEAVSQPYAAVTRWLGRSAPGERKVQREDWKLIHGHGGQIGKTVLLEVCRETDHVRAVSAMANPTGETQREAVSA